MSLVNKVKDRILTKYRAPRFSDLISTHEVHVKKYGIQRGAYLEFGVFKGDSALRFYNALEAFYNGQIPCNQWPMFLFDSFIGLPKSDDPRDQHPAWKEGVFDVGGVDEFVEAIVV